MRNWAKIIAVLLVLLVILTCTGEGRPGLLIFTLLLGWARFLIRVVPQMQWNFSMVGMGVVCLAGTIGIGHLMIGWLARNWGNGGSSWRFRNTLLGVGGVVILFVAGIAASGLVHQSAWLGREKQWFYYGFRRADQFKCQANLRQIGHGILLYANANQGRLPMALADMLKTEDITPELFCCPASGVYIEGTTEAERLARFDPAKHVSYLYRHPGELMQSLPANEILVYETLENHDGEGIAVLYANGAVDWLEKEKAIELLESLDHR